MYNDQIRVISISITSDISLYHFFALRTLNVLSTSYFAMYN